MKSWIFSAPEWRLYIVDRLLALSFAEMMLIKIKVKLREIVELRDQLAAIVSADQIVSVLDRDKDAIWSIKLTALKRECQTVKWLASE